MARRKVGGGLTSAMFPISIKDTSSTTGAGLGSLVFNSSGLVAEYRRQGQSTWTAITLVAGTLGTYISGGFVADGSVGGDYEFCPPDTALASGARWVIFRLRGATNMLPVRIEVELDAVNYQDGVHFGLSALPNAASGTSGAILTSGTGTAQLNVASGIADSNTRQVNGVAVSTSDGTAQAGGASTITLASGDAAGTNAYVDRKIVIVAGTGQGQARIISAYNSATKVATVHRAWDTIPDNTSQYAIDETSASLFDMMYVASSVNTSVTTPTTTVFSGQSTMPSSAAAFDNPVVTFIGGTAANIGLSRRMTYNPTNNVITLTRALPAAPASGDTFRITGD